MPRVSQTALATIELASNVEVLTRLRPPPELAEPAAEEFRRVVGSMPADWFHGGNVMALAQYCRNVIMARRIDEAMELAVLEGRADEIERLARLQISVSRIIFSLMTALRLTPQSVAPNQVSTKKLRNSTSPWRGRQQTQARPSEKE
jgi:hypothetical protein